MKRTYLLLLLLFLYWMYASAQQVQPVREPADSVKNVAYIDSLFRELPEVMITGERPVVKVEQGKLVYDVPRLVSNLPVDNAYDAVKNLPGVVAMNDGMTLGGQPVTVVINGKVSTLSVEQLNDLLKSMPVSRIEKAEVMYSAPARYQVRGPMINLVLTSGTGKEPSLQGELWQSVEASCTPDANSLLIFSTLTLTAANGGRRIKKRFTRSPTVRYTRWICMTSQLPVTTIIRCVSAWTMHLPTSIC